MYMGYMNMIRNIIRQLKLMEIVLDRFELLKRVLVKIRERIIDCISLFAYVELVRRIVMGGVDSVKDSVGGGSNSVSNGMNGMSSNSLVNVGGVGSVSNVYGSVPILGSDGVVYNTNVGELRLLPVINYGNGYGSNVNNPSMYGYNDGYYFNLYYRVDSMYDFIIFVLAMVMIFVIVMRIINYMITRNKSNGKVKRRR